MKHLIKWVVIALVSSTVLLVLIALTLPTLINPNDYRDTITRLIHQHTGLTVNLDGPIRWSVFPWLGLVTEGITVQGTQQAPLARLDSAEISIKLLPLLYRKVDIGTVQIQGLTLTLVRDHAGKGNWAIAKLAIPTAATTTVPADQTATDTTEPALPLPDWGIAAIDIAGLTIDYQDHRTGAHYRIDQASLKTGTLHQQAPTSLAWQAAITSTQPSFRLQTQAQAMLTIDLGHGRYALDAIKATLKPLATGKQRKTVELTGQLHYQHTPMQANGQLDTKPFNLRTLLAQFAIPLPATADPNALTHVAINGTFDTDGQRIHGDKLAVILDDFQLEGHAKLTGGQQPAITFQLHGNHLDLDRYLPPAATTNMATSANPSTAESPATANEAQPLIPEALLRPLQADGIITLTGLTVAQWQLAQPAITVTAANGRQQVKLRAGFYQGNVTLDNTLDVRTPGLPQLHTAANLQAINLQAMAQPMPALKAIQGSANATVNLRTQGQLLDTWLRQLNGTVGFHIDNGAFTAANFDKMVCEGIARVRQRSLQNTDWPPSTPFQQLQGTFTVRNGIASNNDLIAELASLNLKGDGTVDLVQKKLDYRLGLNIRGGAAFNDDPACQINEDYTDVVWPVRCVGTLGEQQCGLDTDRLKDTLVKLGKKEVHKRLKQEINKNVEGPLQDLLKGLF